LESLCFILELTSKDVKAQLTIASSLNS
jgi:hypothetical protein